jgi:hypothetical protein
MLLLEQSFLTPPNFAFTLQQKGIPEEFTLEWGTQKPGTHSAETNLQRKNPFYTERETI